MDTGSQRWPDTAGEAIGLDSQSRETDASQLVGLERIAVALDQLEWALYELSEDVDRVSAACEEGAAGSQSQQQSTSRPTR